MRFLPAELWLTCKTTPHCDGGTQRWQLLQRTVLNVPRLAGCSCTAGLEYALQCFLGVTAGVTSSACWGQAMPRSALQSSLMLKQQGGKLSHHCWALSFFTEGHCRWQLPMGCSGFGIALAAAFGYKVLLWVWAGGRDSLCLGQEVGMSVQKVLQAQALVWVLKSWNKILEGE